MKGQVFSRGCLGLVASNFLFSFFVAKPPLPTVGHALLIVFVDCKAKLSCVVSNVWLWFLYKLMNGSHTWRGTML